MQKSVSIRMGTTGKADVTRDFTEMGASGEASANRWSKAYQRAGEDVEAALQRQANAAAKIAAISPQSPVQMRIADANGTGFGQWEGSARQSAAAFKELLAAEEQLDARTRALVSAIDPAFAAQQRFNAQMAEARDLVSRGAISLDQYVAKLRIERTALEGATVAQDRAIATTRGHGTAMAAVAPQAQDMFTQLSMGANVLSVLAIQGGQAAGQMAHLEGVAGKFGTFMMGPWGLAITGGLLLLGALTDRLLDNEGAAERAEAGMKKFQDRQTDIGNFIDSTTGKLKEQNRTLVLNAILTRQAQIADNNKAITEQRNAAFRAAGNQQTRSPSYTGGSAMIPIRIRETDPDVQRAIAAAGGNVDKLAASIANLAATKRPDLKGLALDISNQAGQAIIATRENAELQKELRALQGDTTALAKADTSLIEARAKLAGATTAADRAQAQYQIRIREADAAYNASGKTQADQAKLLAARTAAEHDLNVAQDANRRTGDRHAQSLARQASAMEVNAEASLELARAYLVGGDAALRAEAARKGLTDATRRGIDTDAQVQRQLQVMVGEQVANGAKSVAQLREETAARAAVRAQVLAGTLSADDMSRALSDEAALRPLLKLQTVAQGEALAQLTEVIDAYRKALAGAHEEEARGGATRAIDASKDRFAETIASIYDLSKDPLSRAMDAARRAAESEADSQNYTGDSRKQFVDARVDEAWAGEAKRRAEYYASTVEDQRDSMQLAQLELALSAANDNERGRQMEKLRTILELKREGVDVDSAEGREILSNQERLDGLYTQAKIAAAGFQELRDFGNDFVDTVLSEDTWSSWGNAGRTMLNMLKGEFIKLALLNPLKNLLNGDKALPTLGSVLGKVTSLFGKPGNNAAGTEWWSGGATYLAENGPELVNLPQGSRVTSAGETRRLLAANDAGGRGDTHNHFHLEGAVMLQDLLDQMNAIGTGAAMQGAAGGAAMAEANGMEAGVRRLGRFR
ncbi:hypothetical protein [Sphingomonas sp. ACRSK]|uniref:hypothetical protein n=1 Tax=Sphingomonas sp. ACRSK TaxID=2918213 RepID=UPI001EF4A314|nr:hypothetical protein [Sphingomonas sp. ACRSK]MCG7349795.1 hypothetical protein [Sphingomonas sp. ACRSK]